MSKASPTELPAVVVVMGVSGSGKSTIAIGLAEALTGAYLDADDLHSDDARATMSAGTPLTDDDRWPWLDRVAYTAAAAIVPGKPVVVACSALRRGYRDRLRAGISDPVFFVHAAGSRELLVERLGKRAGHFMPAGLIDSQLATLEHLEPDEVGVTISLTGTPDDVLQRAGDALRLALSAANLLARPAVK